MNPRRRRVNRLRRKLRKRIDRCWSRAVLLTDRMIAAHTSNVAAMNEELTAFANRGLVSFR